MTTGFSWGRAANLSSSLLLSTQLTGGAWKIWAIYTLVRGMQNLITASFEFQDQVGVGDFGEFVKQAAATLDAAIVLATISLIGAAAIPHINWGSSRSNVGSVGV